MGPYLDIPQFTRDFLNYMEVIKGKSPNTVHEYYYDLKTFFRFLKIHFKIVNNSVEFNEITVDDISIDVIKKITLSDLYEYLSYINRVKNNSASTRSRKVASLKSYFKYLNTKVKLIEDNPAKELDSPNKKQAQPKYLSLTEAKVLLNSIDGKFKERDYCIINLFLNCGMRLSELVSINIRDIRDDKITILGKGNKERTIYLNKSCVSSINIYLQVRPVDGVKDKDALFLSARKQRIDVKTIQYLVKKFIEKAGLDPKKYTPHKLRHTAATLMYRYGHVDIRSLQEILGHKNLSTTEIYTHLDDEQLRDAINRHPLSDI